MRCYLLLLVACWAFAGARAQTPIVNVFRNYQSVTTGTTYLNGGNTYRYGNLSGTANNNQNVEGFNTPDNSFFYNVYVNSVIRIRRVNNSVVTGRRSLVWMESVERGNEYNIFPPYEDLMETFFDGRVINKGTDNLFGNQGDGAGNNNNIERVDWIATEGVRTVNTAQSGFAVFERGADNQHDPFCIAAILELDAAGNPSRYARLVRIASTDYGNVPASALNYTILRKEQAELRLYRSNGGNQNRGGVYISFRDLNIAPNQMIYGYSLFAYDLPANATVNNLLDYTNPAYFPTSTSSITLEGGIDFIAITGLFTSSSIALPIALKTWNLAVETNKTTLRWETGNRERCKNVVLQKSADGATWTDVASFTPAQTVYSDDEVLQQNFYRLKLTDWQGSQHFSTVLSRCGKPDGLIAGSLAAVAQQGQIRLQFLAPANATYDLCLYTLGGQKLVQKKLVVTAGANHIVLNHPPVTGVAVLRLTQGNQVYQTKLQLQRHYP